MGVTINIKINNITTALERTAALATGGAFHWYQIFTLDSAIVEVQKAEWYLDITLEWVETACLVILHALLLIVFGIYL